MSRRTLAFDHRNFDLGAGAWHFASSP